MRIKIKKPMTEDWEMFALDTLERLHKWKEDLQIICMKKSIFNSWQWLFMVLPKDIEIYIPAGRTTRGPHPSGGTFRCESNSTLSTTPQMGQPTEEIDLDPLLYSIYK